MSPKTYEQNSTLYNWITQNNYIFTLLPFFKKYVSARPKERGSKFAIFPKLSNNYKSKIIGDRPRTADFCLWVCTLPMTY